jgi:hypothetical protein
MECPQSIDKAGRVVMHMIEMNFLSKGDTMEQSATRSPEEDSEVEKADKRSARGLFVELGKVTALTRRASGDKSDGSDTSGNNMYSTS